MSREYKLLFPALPNREQVLKFLAADPAGKALKEALLSLKYDPRPEARSFREIDPDTEIAFLAQHVGIPLDKDTETFIKRMAPHCRIEVDGCEIIYDVNDDDGLVYIFKIQRVDDP